MKGMRVRELRRLRAIAWLGAGLIYSCVAGGQIRASAPGPTRASTPALTRASTPARTSSPTTAARETLLSIDFPPEPTATYGSFLHAREALLALVTRTLKPVADTIEVRKVPLDFEYWDRLVVEHSRDGRPYWSLDRRDIALKDTCLSMVSTGPTYGLTVHSMIDEDMICVPRPPEDPRLPRLRELARARH